MERLATNPATQRLTSIPHFMLAAASMQCAMGVNRFVVGFISGGIVLRATMNGVIVRPVTRHKVGDLFVLSPFDAVDGVSTKLMLVEDWKSWRMTALRPTTPRELARAGQTNLTCLLETALCADFIL